ncbi:MAG: GTPase HflX [Calditrichaeota bacterium]|nr:GTPase HflX [Calditrichota bacterium]MCB9391580.1 GTPase HflX [Calditrichota bacterium]
MSRNQKKSGPTRSIGYDRLKIEDASQGTAENALVPKRERAFLIGICKPGEDLSAAQDHLDELAMLAETAGADIVDRELVKLRQIDPALYLGKGKTAEIASYVAEFNADLVVIDEDPAPAQTRNLERELKTRVVDRSGLILDIFARRAQTREAKTQVELAQLKYMLPRLSGAWTHLERQRGGIGMRGPGETQIETDRRLIRTRIRKLEEELSDIERQHRTQRAKRQEVFRFSLAGYTNVGKSTLMNVLTSAGVYEENLLFATLDSTTRMLPIGQGIRAVLSDTVGFIRKLPPGLVASFRSTLDEIREADCIVHVVDIASVTYLEQMETVQKILTEMGLSEVPVIEVFNKMDALDDPSVLRWVKEHKPEAVLVSAKSGEGLESLRERMRMIMEAGKLTLEVELDAANGKLWQELYKLGEVLATETIGDKVTLQVRLSRVDAGRLGLVDRAKPDPWRRGGND